MPSKLHPWGKSQKTNSIFYELYKPIAELLPDMPPLESRGDRPLQLQFEHQIKSLLLFHLEDHDSAAHLLQTLKQDPFAKKEIAPEKGIAKSSFAEAINYRGLEQLLYLFEKLSARAVGIIPGKHCELGDLVAIDGSLIDATLSMYWADYRSSANKAKLHLAFDVNRSIPRKIFFADGNSSERNQLDFLIQPGQTGIMDRGYQCHAKFDLLQKYIKYFVCRIKVSTHVTVLETYKLPDDDPSIISDQLVLLGQGDHQTELPVRLVRYVVDGITYCIATNRRDLSASQIAFIYKLRWEIEKFFGWWKKHLKVYHLIARSPYGMLVQIISGLITYLLLAIYCKETFNEKVSIQRVREIRITLRNEIYLPAFISALAFNRCQIGSKICPRLAKT